MRWVSASLMFLLAVVAHGQEIRGLYLGVGAGLLNYEDDGDESGVRISDAAGIYRIVGGYQLNSNYAIEASWGRSTDIREQFFASLGDQIVGVNIGVESKVRTLRILALAPFSTLSMFGSLGYYDADFTTSCSIEVGQSIDCGSFKSSDSGVTVAGGIQYEWPRIALRGEYEWLDSDVDAAAINVIAVFRF